MVKKLKKKKKVENSILLRALKILDNIQKNINEGESFKKL